ncbi:MAG: F0F1 ATP synthase subunit B [Fimbriimonadaceae bacterium]|nr:F0F1 ATP synthase subunit B [Fimbriimonadaceae bacterium]
MAGIILFVASIFLQTLPFNEALKSNELIKLFDLNIPVIVGTIGLILILWSTIEQFYTGPLWKIINERNSAIESTFTEAEALKAEMQQMKTEYEQRIAKTEADAREQIRAQVAEAQELRKTLMAEAAAKADEFLEGARRDIENERNKALADIRVQVAQLSLGATEKLLLENMDNDRNRKLIDEFLAGAGR